LAGAGDRRLSGPADGDTGRHDGTAVLNYSETPLLFDCCGEQLLGVIAAPRQACALGVLVMVGGGQYRVGSHRQFLVLSRRLAAAGYAVMRFDYRGMGDSGGAPCSFDAIDADIAAALAAFQVACPSVRRVALWGLCDGASAAVLYWQRARDARVAGLCLLNPWLRSEASLARTHLRHYYLQRLLSADFWRKLLGGGVRIKGSLRELLRSLRQGAGVPLVTPYQQLMLAGLTDFPGPLLLVISGRDLTALEFVGQMKDSEQGRSILLRPAVTRVDIAAADHTFSSAAWRQAVEDATLAWLQNIENKQICTS
ncbi:MAG: hydrolase 1, exosortase A system-associated, partial [Nevskiales bacterium]